MRLAIAILAGLLFGLGCSAQGKINPSKLPGRPLEEVVRTYHLDQYHAWPIMNLPESEDPGTIYFLERGNLEIRVARDSNTVRTAEFRSSDKSAEERFHEANAGWDAWVKAHTRQTP